jgi:hypothetical protein
MAEERPAKDERSAGDITEFAGRLSSAELDWSPVC